jgi:hypothetical protein
MRRSMAVSSRWACCSEGKGKKHIFNLDGDVFSSDPNATSRLNFGHLKHTFPGLVALNSTFVNDVNTSGEVNNGPLVPFRTLNRSMRSAVITYVYPISMARLCVSSKRSMKVVESFCKDNMEYQGACAFHFRSKFSIVSPRSGKTRTVVLTPMLSKGRVDGCEHKHVHNEEGFLLSIGSNQYIPIENTSIEEF